ncbi:MAG TPA: lytic transglycosylase domain-containing protein [Acidimicrobiales bacterium]
MLGSLVGVGLGWERVSAQESVVIDDPRLDPSLAGVQVDGDGYRKALAAWNAARARLGDAESRLARVTEEADAQAAERGRLTAEIDDARRRGEIARDELDRSRDSLRTMGVTSYVKGRDTAGEELFAGAAEAAENARGDALLDGVADRRTEEVRAARATIGDTDRTIEDASTRLQSVEERLAAATTARDDLDAEVASLRRSSDASRRSVADWRITADVAGTDLPLVALDAYVKAAARMAFERPGCGIRWSGLAGIGKVESGHGTYGGSRLTAAGVTSQPIVGIPLDGTNGTASISDSDGGELDGDPAVDRAVGPMQFIPTSWRSLGRDGSGDGRADPSNIYDAALSAAGLLCGAGGSGLDTDGGLRRAALGYNNSARYADLVVRTANGYQSAESRIIPPPPTTTTTTPPPGETVPAPDPTPVEGLPAPP